MLYDYLEQKCCSVSLKGKNKESVLKELAALAAGSETLSGYSKEELYLKLQDRENQGSTGFGDSIAIPHARLENINSFIVYIAIHKKGVDFSALDGKKSHIFVVIFGPAEQVNQHLLEFTVIDDDMTVLHLISLILEAEEYQVMAAGSVEKALACMQGNVPDVICCDLIMPYQTGVDLLRIRQQQPALAQVPVIIVSGGWPDDLYQQAQTLGPFMRLAKPFNTTDLVAAIETAVAQPAAELT